MNNYNYNNFLIDIVNILSFAIGLQNLDMNDKQIQQLEEHLNKQDEQYNKILISLEELKILKKGE